MTALQADRSEIAAFVNALFTYADEGTYISLRSFDQFDRNVPAFMIEGVKVNGRTDTIVDRAHAAAQRSADHLNSTVFAPPICTFKQAWGAKGTDLANGVALSLELDEAPGTARIKMEGLLGPATLVVASGSDWVDPETGEIEQKLHLHWRLSEPTRDDVGHGKLRAARTAAALLVGGDPTGKPVVHPYRWAGSWNTKGEPRLCRIVASNEAAEIHLPVALDTVQAAVEAAGLASVDAPVSGDPHAAPERLRSAMAAIPNVGTDVHYSAWIDLGYAVANATNGAGFNVWDQWSRKSDKYDAGETKAAWRRIISATSGVKPTRQIGAGTIIMHAKNAGWRWQPEPPEQEEPPPHPGDGSDRAKAGASSQDIGRVFDPWDALQAPPFPIDALPPVLREFVADRALVIGADPCAIAWAAISACSAALHGGVRLQMKKYDDWGVPPAIWVALVGRSSTKKTPIIDAAWEPLQRAQAIDLKAWRLEHDIWEALPKAEREKVPEPLPARRLITHDGTMEAIQDILSRQDRGIGVLRDELAGWLGQLEKYNGVRAGAADRAFFLQAFNGGSHVVDRVRRGTTPIDNLLATICGGIQPDRLRQFGDLTDDGLWQRFVPIIVSPARMGADCRTGDAGTNYADMVGRMLQVDGGVRVQMSEDAYAIRKAVETAISELEQSEVMGGRFAAFCGKLTGLWGRLALVLNYMNPDAVPHVLSGPHAEAARRLVFECALPHAARVYAAMGGGGADAEATQSVAGFILIKRLGRLLASDLTRNVRACRGRSLDDLQKVVSPLVAGGWLEPERDYNPTVWIVNPAVHTQFAARAKTEVERRVALRSLIVGQTNATPE